MWFNSDMNHIELIYWLIVEGVDFEECFERRTEAVLDGTIQTASNYSLRQMLTDFTNGVALAIIRSKVTVTFSTSKSSSLQGGAGTDWFWYTAAINTDRVTSGIGAEPQNY